MKRKFSSKEEDVSKKQKLRNITVLSYPSFPTTKDQNCPIILTHGASFHCDDVLACGFLTCLSPNDSSIVIRINHSQLAQDKKEKGDTEEGIMNKCDYVVDIGSEYNHTKKFYDHHQRTFKETFSKEFKTKLSSCGLIFKHYGKQIISKRSKFHKIQLTEKQLNWMHKKLYISFVEHIDANDNGISVCDCGELKYKISTSLPTRIGTFNIDWNEDKTTVDVNDRFSKAVDYALSEFLEFVDYFIRVNLPARKYVEEAIAKRIMNGRAMELTTHVPWKNHVFDIEGELDCLGELLFVIFVDPRNAGGWRIMCVPEKLGCFGDRLSLPVEWRGLRDEELSKKSGIEGCTFVHASGFTGGNTTKEGIMKMMEYTIKQSKKFK